MFNAEIEVLRGLKNANIYSFGLILFRLKKIRGKQIVLVLMGLYGEIVYL